ncbi:hypothetical protein ACA910_001588 [Epithemia clementina (nom. ined.)]
MVWKSLSAQKVWWPLIVTTVVSNVLVFPMTLQFFDYLLDEGFLAPAWATVIYYLFECVLVLSLLGYYQPHYPETWPDITNMAVWQQALAWPSMSAYLSLGLGGILTYLEWVYWEALSLMVGTFGVLPLSAHTIPSQILDVAYMLPWAMGIAVSIHLGHLIAKPLSSSSSSLPVSQPHVPQSQTLACMSLLTAVMGFGIPSIFLYLYARPTIVHWFTEDEDVMELCRQIWFHVCMLFFVLAMYAVVIGIAIGLGLQWTLGIVTVLCLWCVGFPAAYYLAVVQGGGLQAAWMCFWPPYVLINLIMCLVFWSADWNDISYQIRQREGLVADDDDDASNLKDHKDDSHDSQNATKNKSTRSSQHETPPPLDKLEEGTAVTTVAAGHSLFHRRDYYGSTSTRTATTISDDMEVET